MCDRIEIIFKEEEDCRFIDNIIISQRKKKLLWRIYYNIKDIIYKSKIKLLANTLTIRRVFKEYKENLFLGKPIYITDTVLKKYGFILNSSNELISTYFHKKYDVQISKQEFFYFIHSKKYPNIIVFSMKERRLKFHRFLKKYLKK